MTATATERTSSRAEVRRPGRRNPAPYLFILPAVLVLALVFGYPLLTVIWDSFSVPQLLGTSSFGLDNYATVLTDPLFLKSLLNNLRLFLAVPILTIVAVPVAALLFERVRGWRIYQSIAFVPYVIAIPVVGIVFSYVLQRNGVLNDALHALRLDALVHDWLGDSGTAIWSVLFVIVWQQLGFGIVLFVARLSSLENSLIEAALLDRANWWQRFWNILIPHLATTIEFFFTLSLINMLSWVFNYVFVMTGGGPAQSTNVLEMLLYTYAFRDGLPNLAAALSVIVLLISLVLLAIQAAIRRRVERLEN